MPRLDDASLAEVPRPQGLSGSDRDVDFGDAGRVNRAAFGQALRSPWRGSPHGGALASLVAGHLHRDGVLAGQVGRPDAAGRRRSLARLVAGAVRRGPSAHGLVWGFPCQAVFSSVSVAAVATRRVDRLKLLEVEL